MHFVCFSLVRRCPAQTRYRRCTRLDGIRECTGFDYASLYFRGLTLDDEADFLAALKPGTDGSLEAHITVRYSDADSVGRLRAKRWCGDHEDVSVSSDMMENLLPNSRLSNPSGDQLFGISLAGSTTIECP
jgi:hypothetical protein